MLTVLSCIATEHNPLLLIVAAFMCVVGSILTMRLYARVRRTVGAQQINWLFMSSVIGGLTVWTTHFLAMLSFQSGLPHAYEPELTILSLVLIIGVTMLGFAISAFWKAGATIEIGGAVFGSGIAAMHFLGMRAYIVEGQMQWDPWLATIAIVLGIGFGAVATNRIARPVTRFCKYGGAISMVLAVVSMHFTAMSAITILPDASIVAPGSFLSDSLLAIMVTSFALVILGLGASTYFIDGTTTRVAAERLHHLSYHDPLTGLPNRAGLLDFLRTCLLYQKDSTARFAVVSFDIHQFKDVNDVYGRQGGDALLRVVGQRLADVLANGEYVARTEGDAFVAVSGTLFTRSEARIFANRIVASLSQPIEWRDRSIRLDIRAGVAVYPIDAGEIDDVLVHADLARYRAKTMGFNTVCLYESTMDALVRDRSILAFDMRLALERGDFELYYQCQNHSLTRSLLGFEVLLRWKHPVRGFVSPVEFIPIAERNGLMRELGDFVLNTACRQAVSWKNPYRIAVNVAPSQLANSHFPERVRQILQETGLDPHRLELEITESGIIHDQQRALAIIHQLKALGVRIAMDDYGTGYSSLSTLQTFPFDKIKIDRAFITSVGTNGQSAAIVRSTIILAQSLDIAVLAEGVETEEEMAFLLAAGCLQVQGYLFGKPMPLADIDAMVNGVEADLAIAPLPPVGVSSAAA